MRPAFHPRLVNDPFSDPGLIVPFHYERRALLFDLGDPSPLSPRELLQVSHVFVSHTHVDHFIGFDPLLRVFLGREKKLHLFGPPGFSRRVEGKLSGYTWNLVHRYENDLDLVVSEVCPECVSTRRYSCREGFGRAHPEGSRPFDGVLLREPEFRVESALVDHRIPCLAFSLVERFHVNIDKVALAALGLPVGRWIDRFKAALYEGADPAGTFAVTWEEGGGATREKRFRLGELAERAAIITPGSRISYITDMAGTRENLDAAVSLAAGSDHLFIEAAFLDRDRDLARDRDHLTAAQAGEVAARAGAGAFTLFHYSPRYRGCEESLLAEAEEAFSQAAADQPSPPSRRESTSTIRA